MARFGRQDEENQWKKWLHESSLDLESGKVLYEKNLHSHALFHLQQANEKLLKGLLLSIGLLVSERSKKDDLFRLFLRFTRKTPRDYSHTPVSRFMGDLEQMIPSMEDLIDSVIASTKGEEKEKLVLLKKQIRDSKSSVRKLKIMSPSMKTSEQEVENELKGSLMLLETTAKLNELMQKEFEKVDIQHAINTSFKLLRRAGIRLPLNQTDFQLSKEDVQKMIFPSTRSMGLVIVSMSISLLLDSLESITRYPDKIDLKFDEGNPYVKHFLQVHDIISKCLKMSEEAKLNSEDAQL